MDSTTPARGTACAAGGTFLRQIQRPDLIETVDKRETPRARGRPPNDQVVSFQPFTASYSSRIPPDAAQIRSRCTSRARKREREAHLLSTARGGQRILAELSRSGSLTSPSLSRPLATRADPPPCRMFHYPGGIRISH